MSSSCKFSKPHCLSSKLQLVTNPNILSWLFTKISEDKKPTDLTTAPL